MDLDKGSQNYLDGLTDQGCIFMRADTLFRSIIF
jgi:hypothetical protein